MDKILHQFSNCFSASTSTFLCTLAACLLFGSISVFAESELPGFTRAISKDALDFEACKSFDNGEPSDVKKSRLLQAAGLVRITDDTEGWNRSWSAGKVGWTEGKKGIEHTYHYRIAWEEPREVGSIMFPTHEVRILKPDAPYPGDPQNEDHWRKLSVPKHEGDIKLVPLPPDTKTRAVLLTDRDMGRGKSVGTPVRIYKPRLYNIAPLAQARAKNEYDAPDNFGGGMYRASDVVEGRGTWQNNGENENGFVEGPYISDVDSTWFALGWEEPRKIAGIFTRDNFWTVKFQKFVGSESLSPLIALDDEWHYLEDSRGSTHMHARSNYGRWVEFSPPLETRGFRFLIEKTWERGDGRTDSQIARINDLIIFKRLGDDPAPEAEKGVPPPPVSITYQTEETGTATMAINDENGNRLRNLFARRKVEEGKHKARWDLKTKDGEMVEPGTYRWKAINGPELKLEYEMSVYPNVSVHHPENTAWLNGESGPGGWLGDHSPPFGVGTAGNNVCFTLSVPEAGVGFAVTNLEGKKQWGIGSFASWSGGKRVAGTEDTAYVEQFRDIQEGGEHDRIWAVDLASQEYTTILKKGHSETRRRGIKGLAARKDRVYAAVDAASNWISNATGAGTVNITECLPSYKEEREKRTKYEIVPDKRNDFLRLLRLKGKPPGYSEDHGLIWLESTEGPGMEQYIMVVFKKPIAIGSCLFPVPQDKEYQVRLNVLKEDAPVPPDPEDKEMWKPFETHGDNPWDIAIAPENTRTRALLVRFIQGEGDEVSQILRGGSDDEKGDEGLSLDSGGDDTAQELGLSDGNAWKGRLEGMQILRRRYKNLFEECSVRVSSGEVDQESGKWVADREEPLTKRDPAVYLMTWDDPVELRGLAFKEIDAKTTKVDVWTGPESGQIPLEGDDEHWKTVGSYRSRRRMEHFNFEGHNPLARYLEGRVDFGEIMKTRAVRLRCVSQWKTEMHEGSCAKGRLQLDPTRCRVFGVAPLQYIGGEYPVDPRFSERIEVVNPDVENREETVEKEISIDAPDALAFDNDGNLLAISGKDIVRVDMSGDKEHEPVVTDLKKPTTFAVDKDNNIYVFDTHPSRKVIRVYDEEGKYQRKIGKTGGYQAGPWDPMRFQNLSGMSIAKDGKLWVVDSNYWPKRCSAFTTDGEHLRDYLGPTQYGGGGVLDPYDKTRLVYGFLEFDIDWETGKSHLENLLWTKTNWPRGEIHIKYKGHDFFTNQAPGAKGTMPVAMVYRYETDHLVPAAAMGAAAEFPPLSRPEFQEKTGGELLKNLEFNWSDTNKNGHVDPEEVTFRQRQIPKFTRFNEDMGIQAGEWRFEVERVEEGGIPVYKRKRMDLDSPMDEGVSQVYRLRDGGYYMMGDEYPDTGFRPDGSVAWTYPNEGAGVGPNRSMGSYTPGQVVCQFGLAGHAVATGGDLGEFFVMRNNLGTWYLWTADGLLASRIFKDPRQPESIMWTMRENDRNMDLTNVSLKGEHFKGWFTREKGTDNYYAVAGKPHSSVVQVKGLNNFHRMQGTVEVTPEDVKKTLEWQKIAARRKAEKEDLKYYHCFPVKDKIVPNGSLNEWEKQPWVDVSENISFSMAYDEENLYVAYKVKELTDLVNQGNRWDRLFKTGACLDLRLQTNREVAPERETPEEGDLRILFSRYKGELTAVLYQPVAPDASEEYEWTVESPVHEVNFDLVRRFQEAEIGYRRKPLQESKEINQFTLEAAIPLDAIDFEIEPNLRVKMDWGYLESDQQGTTVKARRYWANDGMPTVADTPSEASLAPDLWGYVEFQAKPKGADKEMDPMELDEKEEEEDDGLGIDTEEMNL